MQKNLKILLSLSFSGRHERTPRSSSSGAAAAPPLATLVVSGNPPRGGMGAAPGDQEIRSLSRTTTSVTDDDLEDLKGCIELGFGFDSMAVVDPKLADTLPALGLYQAVNRQYHRSLSRSSSATSIASSSSEEEMDGQSACSLYDPGDDPATVKTGLRQWAQVVACCVRQPSMSCSPLLPSPP